MDDLVALKALSLTCKCLFGATRPLIHQRLVCWDSRTGNPKPEVSLFRGDPGTPRRLIEADRSGLLRYTQHLTFKLKSDSFSPNFNLRDMQ